jgi:hypothetical protein
MRQNYRSFALKFLFKYLRISFRSFVKRLNFLKLCPLSLHINESTSDLMIFKIYYLQYVKNFIIFIFDFAIDLKVQYRQIINGMHFNSIVNFIEKSYHNLISKGIDSLFVFIIILQ